MADNRKGIDTGNKETVYCRNAIDIPIMVC